jgi:hypothetical protein
MKPRNSLPGLAGEQVDVDRVDHEHHAAIELGLGQRRAGARVDGHLLQVGGGRRRVAHRHVPDRVVVRLLRHVHADLGREARLGRGHHLVERDARRVGAHRGRATSVPSHWPIW